MHFSTQMHTGRMNNGKKKTYLISALTLIFLSGVLYAVFRDALPDIIWHSNSKYRILDYSCVLICPAVDTFLHQRCVSVHETSGNLLLIVGDKHSPTVLKYVYL